MIKKTIFILACALMELAPSGIITYAADQNRPKKIKVLLIDGQNNHDWVRCSPVMMDTLNATGRFSIDRSTVTKPDIEKFNPNFADYDVVLSNYNGERWKKETEEAFVKYIKEGGNLVVVHAANNSFPDWKEFNEMIGLGGWGGRKGARAKGRYVRARKRVGVRRMENSPNLMAQGKMMMREGYSFSWPAYSVPTLTDPNGEPVPLLTSALQLEIVVSDGDASCATHVIAALSSSEFNSSCATFIASCFSAFSSTSLPVA